jgi:hypothetical protein
MGSAGCAEGDGAAPGGVAPKPSGSVAPEPSSSVAPAPPGGSSVARQPRSLKPVVELDATSAELAATAWPVSDTNVVTWDQGARAASVWCVENGYVGGAMNGEQYAGNFGVVCYGVGSQFFDVTDADIDATGWSFATTAPAGTRKRAPLCHLWRQRASPAAPSTATSTATSMAFSATAANG